MSNKAELKIEGKSRSYAKIYSSMITDEYQRKRANAAITALFSYVSYLKEFPDLKIQNSMTLYRNPEICNQYEIADFYINNYHIDVRVTDNDNAVLLPKTHYDNDIVPDFYVVIKVDKDIQSASLLGIIDTGNVKPQPFDFHYYMVSSQEFISNEDFINRISTEKQPKFDEKEHEKFIDNYLSFIDGEISKSQQIEIIRHLFKCSECRKEFCCFIGFEMVNCNAAHYPEIFEDNTLNIIGAQAVDTIDYQNKEEQTVYTGDDEKLIEKYNKPAEKETETEFEKENLNEGEEPESKDNNDFIDELFGDDDEMTEDIEKTSGDSDLQIINDNPENTVQNEMSVIENNDVEKVIIDYDENGKPIYSYMNNTDGIIPIEEDTIDDIFMENDNKMPNVEDLTDLSSKENENTQISINEESENQEEVDILDQMFVDGALERERKEQQELSYVPLTKPSTPVINQNSINVENKIIKEEKNDDFDIIENIEDENKMPSVEEILEEVEETEEEQVETQQKNEENELAIVEEISESEDNETAYKTTEAEEQQTTEDIKLKENEEEISISDEQNIEPAQLFDEYIESELSKNDEENEEKETDEEYDEYGDEYDEENEEMKNMNSKKSPIKKFIIAICIIAILLLACGIGAFFHIKHNNNTVESYDNNLQETINDENVDLSNIPDDTDISSEQTESVENIALDTETTNTNADTKQDENITEKDINKAITKALSTGENLVILRGLSWFCSAELFNDKAFKAYMQNIDNGLKQNLKNNIFGITEIPPKNEVTAKFAVDNERNLRKVVITESSGSEEIDKIVLQSINETFDGEKSPILSDSPLKADMYYFKVVIKF